MWMLSLTCCKSSYIHGTSYNSMAVGTNSWAEYLIQTQHNLTSIFQYLKNKKLI